MKPIYSACFVLLLAGTAVCQSGGTVFRSDYQYFSDADGWFKLHQMPLNWQEARIRCAHEGAILSSPTTYGLTAVIKNLAAKHKVVVYTGINAILAPGDFNSLDAIPFSEITVRWRPGNPDNQNNNEKCIVYHGEGLFEDVDCDRPFPYICYRKHSKDMVITECGTVDTEYKLDPRTNRCYKIHRIGRPYWIAAGVCTAEGGYLAIINSVTEAEVLKEIFAENPAEKLSVSFKDAVRLGFYNWRDSNFFGTLEGQSLKEAGYDVWADGQPTFHHNGSPQRCGGMFRNARLEDTNCEDNLAFICEKHPESLRKSTIDIRNGS